MEGKEKSNFWVGFSWQRFVKAFLFCFFILMSVQMLHDYKNWQQHFDTKNLLAKIIITTCFAIGINLIKRDK